ncbi:predicted O-methyltransferase YrrM [Bacteroidales bacterium 6E]|nr:predicted O-methyltransferase YrrM [Bacteroidales bacterium 6E]
MVKEDILHYIETHIDPQDDILVRLERETALNVINPRMLSGHLQGQILTMLARMIKPRSILEIGTFTGYSAICLARGLQSGGKLVTIEVNDELKGIAHKYFTLAGLDQVIDQRIGSALEVLQGLKGPFDLVFIDGDKREYGDYYELTVPLVKPGGWILADNTLWDGKVVSESADADTQTRGIMEFNARVAADQQVEKVILPLRDGLTIIRKKDS